MSNILTKNNPINYLLIFFIGIAVWTIHFIWLTNINFCFSQQMLLFDFFKITTLNHYLNTVLAFGVHYLLAIYLIILNQKHIYIENAYQLPGVIYILLSGLHPSTQIISPALIASFFIIASIDSITPIYHKPKILKNCFNSGFLLGLGTLFYIHTFWFLIVVFTAIIVIRPFYWREYITSIMGFVTPIVLLFIGMYMLNQQDVLIKSLSENLSLTLYPEKYQALNLIGLFPIIIIGLYVALFQFGKRIYKKVITRKHLQIIFVFIMLGIISISSPYTQIDAFSIFLLPISLMISFYLINNNHKLFHLIMIGIIIINIIFSQIAHLFYYFEWSY